MKQTFVGWLVGNAPTTMLATPRIPTLHLKSRSKSSRMLVGWSWCEICCGYRDHHRTAERTTWLVEWRLGVIDIDILNSLTVKWYLVGRYTYVSLN